MVSIGTINGDSTNFEAILNNYLEKINSIGSETWEGKSIDSLKEKVQRVAAEYKSVISELTTFASAVKLAQEYNETKEKYDEYVKKRDNWTRPINNPTASNPYSDNVRESKEKLEKIQKNIDSTLSGI